MSWILVLYIMGNDPPRLETNDVFATKQECLAVLNETARTNPDPGFFRCEPIRPVPVEPPRGAWR